MLAYNVLAFNSPMKKMAPRVISLAYPDMIKTGILRTIPLRSRWIGPLD